MSSPAAVKYKLASTKARLLRKTATDIRLRPISREQTQVYYHSALAAFVAGWDAYINDLVRNFFDVTSDPLNTKFFAVHTIARGKAYQALERFNTPNWDNTRNLLVGCTGYTQSPTGKIRLTAKAIDEVDAFFEHLVAVTDLGMKRHIEVTYNLSITW